MPTTAGRTTKAQQRDALLAMFNRYKTPQAELVKVYRKTWTGNDGKLKQLDLSYLGHADLTQILLTEDPTWNWEPMGRTEHGTPYLDRDGKGHARGLWITLTVHGHARIGYGTCPAGKGDAQKILIGNALRNAAMRFGIGLSLWNANTDALLEVGLNPDDQAVVEGDDDEGHGDPDEGGPGAPQDAPPAQDAPKDPPPPAAPEKPTQPPRAASSGQCPECHGPAGKHATGCKLAGSPPAAPPPPDPPATDPAPAAQNGVNDELTRDQLEVEVGTRLNAMRGPTAAAFSEAKREKGWPSDMTAAPDDVLRDILAWLMDSPVERVHQP